MTNSCFDDAKRFVWFSVLFGFRQTLLVFFSVRISSKMDIIGVYVLKTYSFSLTYTILSFRSTVYVMFITTRSLFFRCPDCCRIHPMTNLALGGVVPQIT